MSSQVCSYYSLFRKCLLTIRRIRISFLVVFGGVLLALGLALIPHNSYALDYSLDNVGSNFTADYGCNTVSSDSGVLAIGARGGLTGVDNNSSGCGYYRDSNGNHWLDSEYTGICYFSDNGSLINCNPPTQNRFNSSLQYDDYISKNFRSAVKKISTASFSVQGSNFETISSNSTGDYLSLVFFRIPSLTIPSHITPSIIFNTGNPPLLYKVNNGLQSFTEQEKQTFMEDLYKNTIFEYGSPKDYVDSDLYSELMTTFNLSSDDDWDTQDWAFIASYLPTYDFDYQISHLSYSVSTPLVQGSITGLEFSVWYVGLGNSSSSNSFPKLDYFLLSPKYNKNNLNSTTELISSMRSFSYKCLSSTCSNNNKALLSRYNTKHDNDTNGWDFASNPAGQWFNVFSGLAVRGSVINPFSVMFRSFTNSQCVNIPIIAGMLNVSNTQYCSWWGGNVRQILTPVFTISSIILLFGFIMYWLRGNDHPIFSSKQIKGDK